AGRPAERPERAVREAALREVPAVAPEVRLRDQLRAAVPRRQGAQPVGADRGLALLGDDDVLRLVRRPERPGDGAAVSARADHEIRDDRSVVGRDLDAAPVDVDPAHAHALAYADAGRLGAAEPAGVRP